MRKPGLADPENAELHRGLSAGPASVAGDTSSRSVAGGEMSSTSESSEPPAGFAGGVPAACGEGDLFAAGRAFFAARPAPAPLRPLPFGAGGDTVTARAPQASDRVAQARPPGAPRRVAHAMLGAAVRSTGSLIDPSRFVAAGAGAASLVRSTARRVGSVRRAQITASGATRDATAWPKGAKALRRSVGKGTL